MTRLFSTVSALAATTLAAVSATAQSTPVPLNYNFNGIIHAGEAGLPDDPAGFRSISDRALDFSAGVPNNPLLANYQLVATPGTLDIVHLGNRNVVAGGIWAFDAVPDGDNIGIQPTWLTNVDQSTPQTTVLTTPIPVVPDSSLGFLYQISNGGGSFDVTVTFASGSSTTATLSGPDWFTGSFLGTGGTDQANPDNNLSLTEGRVDLNGFVGDVITEISFSNQSNTNGGYAIVACNFGVQATTSVLGQGCIREFTSFYEQLTTTGMDLDGFRIDGLNTGSGYLVQVLPGAGSIAQGPNAVVVAAGDDDFVDTATIGGTLGIFVGSNCNIARGGANSANFTPDVATMLGNAFEGLYAWTDLHSASGGGSGDIYYEENGTTATVTYLAVAGWNTGLPNTVQFIWDTATGNFSIEFESLNTTNPEDWLVGYSVAGASADPGPTDISTASVILTGANDIIPLSLQSLTNPVLGTSWDLDVVDIPSTTVFGVSFWGLSDPGILDLSSLGLPGCQLRANADVFEPAWLPTGATFTYSLAIPATPAALVGLEIFSQSATFGNPAVNAFGAITSNGIRGVLGSF